MWLYKDNYILEDNNDTNDNDTNEDLFFCIDL